MARNHRVFIAFPIEDERTRDLLVGQMRNNNSPFKWTDLSVKEPWTEQWREQCLTRIKGCDGMIAIVSSNTAKAAGQLYEMRMAREVGIPLVGIYASQQNRPSSLPAEFRDVRVLDWTWPNISSFLSRL